MVRPSTDVPLSLLIACSASSGVAISTKPKPRERPVSRSVTTAADSTLPVAAKTSRRRSLEVEKDNPPTKSLTAMGSAPLGPGTLNRAAPDWPEYTLDPCGIDRAIPRGVHLPWGLFRVVPGRPRPAYPRRDSH